MNNNRYDIIVVGGGIIGLSTSYYLGINGFNVALFDKREVGCEASSWNAGLIVPGMYEPLPLAAGFNEILKWFLNPKSPIRIGIKDFDLKWILTLLANRNKLRKDQSWRDLRKIGVKAIELIEDIVQNESISCDYRKGDIIEVYSSRKMFEKAKKYADEVNSDGLEVVVLHSKEVKMLEPSLSTRIIGGLHYKLDSSLNPQSYINGLKNAVKRRGVEIYENTEVQKVEVEGKDEVTIYTSHNTFKCKWLVLACGPWTNTLLKSLGYKLLLKPMRGYIITLESNKIQPLSRPIMIEEVRVVVSPESNRLTRIGGVLDMVGFDRSIPWSRIRWILSETSKFIPYIKECKIKEVHVAFRPCTPDGIPVVGKLPSYDNIYIATGHCRYGLTYSGLTGMIITQMLKGEKPMIDTKLLNPKRLLRRIKSVHA